MRRIAFVTDIHLDEQFPLDNNVMPAKNFERVIADIESRNIAEVIFGGDIGEPTAHKYFFEKLQRFSFNIVLGNHDKFDKVSEHYNKGISKSALFYKTEDETYQYIFLDTSADELSETQLEWIKNELSEKKQLILFIHHPVLAVDTPVDMIYPLKNRAALKSILLNFNNKVSIFCGHYHMNDEQVFENITQYITQSLSYQIVKNAKEIEVDNANFGYRIIEISNNEIKTEAIHFKQ